MCGIAGSLNSGFSYEAVIKTMGHRGPDEQNGYEYENVRFFHLRLSILDFGGGRQPMLMDERFAIIFNGEIYNHAELREQFHLNGQTSSDTETLLLLYEKFGNGFLHYLDGMFAFVIHDKVKNELFVARDRAGKKPLYYYLNDHILAFASELNCLAAMVPLELNREHFFQYLRLGSFYRQCTPYKDVTELVAGCCMVINCKTLAVNETRWWNINDFYQLQSSDTLTAAIQKTDDFLHQAVKRRIESSDLEVGSFLSGGIDSGIVTAIAREYNHRLKTFTVSFEGEYDEAPLARIVAEKYKTAHTEIRISFANLKNELEGILSNYGEPFFDSSAIPSYYVSREAKKYVTVVLNGDGADELFGGYRRYVPFARYDFFRKNLLLRKAAAFFRDSLSQPKNRRSLHNYLFRLASLASKSSLEIYLSAGVDIFEDYERYILKDSGEYLQPFREDFDRIADSHLSGLKKLMNLDFDTNLFDDLLVKMDIATMANSQEGRSPFLCKELLEYIPALNDKFKIKGKTTKYMLRKLADKYLPPNVINQPKRGFEIPLKNWVDNELKEIVFDYLQPEQCFCKDFVSRGFVNDLLLKKINISAEKRAKILWTLLSMEIWYKKIYQ